MALNINEMCEYARYTDILETTVNNLGGKEVLRLAYESDYQGEVDIDVLLEDGRVFSYQYYYGSCSGCDEWEDRNFNDGQIEIIMLNEATFFDDVEQYKKWRETL